METYSLIYSFLEYLKSFKASNEKFINKLEKEFILNEEDSNKVKEAYDVAIGNVKYEENNKIYKLKNIFSDCSINNKDKEKETYIPFKCLNLGKELLNRDINNIVQKPIWDKYINEVISKIIRFKNDFDKLYFVCMKYFSNIPALNKEKYDISLFDICKITCALSQCLKEDEDNFILIKGGISGIQKFIYKTNASDGLKMLKARSLYISMFQDICAKYIVRELNLNNCNILYSGGGNFYILASKLHVTKFKECVGYINKNILAEHKGDLYLGIAAAEFNKSEFNNFEEVWKRVNDELGKAKYRKWAEIGLKENFDSIFGSKENSICEGGPLEKTCSICGRIAEEKTDEDSENRCSMCNSYVEFMDNAKNKKFYIEDFSEYESSKIKALGIFNKLKYDISFSNDIKNEKDKKYYSINNLKNEDIDGYIFKSVKLKNNSLDDIAKSDTEIGDTKIGVIKLDVDNLGKLFIQTTSISKIMGLSRNIAMFFEGFVEQAIENNYVTDDCKDLKTSNWKDKVNIIYAGGDDTFIVGRYDEVFEFAYALRKAFAKFVSNEYITFSCGIGMFSPNFPIVETANITEDFLDMAKSIDGKDRVCFLGEVFTWKEFLHLIKLKNQIIDVYNSTGKDYTSRNKAVFEKIAKSTSGFKAVFKNGSKSINYLKLYRLAYYLRDLRDKGDKDLVEELINEYEKLCLDALKEKNSRNKAMIIPLANKWAQCNCRKMN